MRPTPPPLYEFLDVVDDKGRYITRGYDQPWCLQIPKQSPGDGIDYWDLQRYSNMLAAATCLTVWSASSSAVYSWIH